MSEPVRRLELFTGSGRRRTWSPDEKAAIIAESEAPDISISAVARRHGLSTSQLFTWRRLARRAAMADRQDGLRFVPAVLMPERPDPAPAEAASGRQRRTRSDAGIAVELAGAKVHIGSGASEAQIAMVIRALKACV